MYAIVPEDWETHPELDPRVTRIAACLIDSAFGEEFCKSYRFRAVMSDPSWQHEGTLVEIEVDNIAHNQLVMVIHREEEDKYIHTVTKALGFTKIRLAKILVPTATGNEDWYVGVAYSGAPTVAKMISPENITVTSTLPKVH